SVDLDSAGRQVGIGGFRSARLYLTVDSDDAFHAQVVEDLQRRRIGVAYDLGDAVMIAKIDEQHTAVVALPVDPARQADRLPYIIGPQSGAAVGTVGVHQDSFRLADYGAREPALTGDG